MTGVGDKVRLAGFFARLAVKEHLAPRLHVRPLVAELFLTDNCNLKCVSCACWRTVTRRELDGDEWRGVIDQIAELRHPQGQLHRRRAVAAPGRPELMAYARDAGIRSLHLNTNAILLDDRRLGAVLDAGVRSSTCPSTVRTRSGTTGSAAGPGRSTRPSTHCGGCSRTASELDMRVRMNYTVMRSTVAALPEIMRLAQRLRVQLYLNLATDHTFLFRDGQVSIEARVDQGRVDAALAEVEQVLRADRRFLPRYSELAYLRGHFADLLQKPLPCAESQLKLMVHSTGEVGGCWGHDATANVRTTPLEEIVAGAAYREEHARFFRKECVGCGSNYALNLAWRPRTYAADVLWRAGRRSLAPVAA